MTSIQMTTDVSKSRSKILSWLESRLNEDAFLWISEKSEDLWNGGEDWEFFSSFSVVPKYTGKSSLDLSDEEIRSS